MRLEIEIGKLAQRMDNPSARQVVIVRDDLMQNRLVMVCGAVVGDSEQWSRECGEQCRRDGGIAWDG